MNTYQYLPRASCHRLQSFNSLVYGEALRIHKRCTDPQKITKHLNFFKSQLIKRGYLLDLIDRAFRRASNSSGPRSSTSCRKAFLKIKHSTTVNYAVLGRSLLQHSHLLINSRVLCAISSQKNIFRLLYDSTWRQNSARGGWAGS